MNAPLMIGTSNGEWFASLADAYKQGVAIRLIDDGALGVDPVTQTLLQLARRASLLMGSVRGGKA